MHRQIPFANGLLAVSFGSMLPMPANKRMKREMHPSVLSSRASTAVPTSQTSLCEESEKLGKDEEEWVEEWLVHKAEPESDDGKDVEDGEEGEDFPEVKREDADGFRLDFDQFLTRPRNFYQMAVQLLDFKGLDVYSVEPTRRGILHEWFHRYHPGVLDDNALWTFSFGETGGPRPLFKATLTAHSLKDRKFESEWCVTRRLAELSAIKVFREDPEVQQIAKLLPPSQKKIKDKASMKKEEKDALKARGIDSGMVHKELVQRVYIHFRDLGCRNALWDGNAWTLPL